MGRKRKSASPVKRSSPSKQRQKEDPAVEKEDHSTSELVQDPEHDPLATSQGGEEELVADGGGGGGEWEDKCRQWVVDQEEPESPPGPEPLPDEDHDEVAPMTMDAMRRPLRDQLKDLTERQIMNSVMFECEWERCGFECNIDLEYQTHVEEHVRKYLEGAGDSEGLVCYWDLCDFQTLSPTDLESHVHFHTYHNRIKTYGASLGTVIEIPKCNNDSRRRNCIDMFKTAFRCEWGNCNEQFNKAVPFFQHVNDHVRDQFPVDKKSVQGMIVCQWMHCKQEYQRRCVALEHVRRHSTERTIGCFNCGAIFTSRLKYIDHCKRQVDYQLREIPCPDCEKLYATVQLMQDHRTVHNKRYQCTQCPMKWPSQKALACHIRYRHNIEKPFKCHLCEHRTVTKADLDEHVITHDDRKTFRCEDYGCNAAYKCQKSLKKHVDRVHCGYGPSVYACHLCKNTYISGANLTKHLEKVHQLQRPPGYNRNVYRADEHGVFRLANAEDSSPLDVINPSSSKSKPPTTKRRPSDHSYSDSDGENSDGDGNQGTFTSYKIAKVEPLSAARFAIELHPGEELPRPPVQTNRRKRKTPKAAPASEASSGSSPPPHPQVSETSPQLLLQQLKQEDRCDSPKNIDDFTVMKRYLKTERAEKPVVISYEETDATGSVIRSETVQTSEISRDRLGKGGGGGGL